MNAGLMTKDFVPRHQACLHIQGLTGTIRTSLTLWRKAYCIGRRKLWQGLWLENGEQSLLRAAGFCFKSVLNYSLSVLTNRAGESHPQRAEEGCFLVAGCQVPGSGCWEEFVPFHKCKSVQNKDCEHKV